MSRELFHICGPFAIQGFGLMITIGLAVFTWLVYSNPTRKKLISDEQFSTSLMLGIISGILGARLMYIFQEFHSFKSIWEVFYIWQGGGSVLGTIFAVGITIGLYLRKIKAPVLPLLDLATMYAPLFQSISRLGCLFAGCCYGLPSSLPWAITYTNPHSSAPLGIAMHPTQLYSSLTLLTVFLIIRFIASPRCTVPGQITSLYFVLAGAERFFVDFWRNDRSYFDAQWLNALSMYQWMSLGMMIGGLCIFGALTAWGRRKHHS